MNLRPTFLQDFRRKWFGWSWRLGVSLAIFAWILSQLDLAHLVGTLVAPHWVGLIAMVCAGIIFLLLGGFKVWVLLRALRPVRLQSVMSHFMVATSIGSFTPAALGDFSIAGFLRKEGIPVHEGLSVMLIDRVIALTVYALVFTPLTLGMVTDLKRIWWVFAAIAGLIVCGFVLNSITPIRRMIRVHLFRDWLPRIEEFARAFSDLLRLYPLQLAGNVCITILRSIVAGIVVEFALVAVGEQSNLFTVICATNSLTIVNLLPISIGGFGTYEGSGVVLFRALGLNPNGILAALLYQRLYIWLSSFLILAAYVFWSIHMNRPSSVIEGTPRR